MGWIFSIGCWIMYLISKDSVMLIASSLFAIAGSIALNRRKD